MRTCTIKTDIQNTSNIPRTYALFRKNREGTNAKNVGNNI